MIKIGDDYAIGSNSLNVILFEKHTGQRGKSKGKELWRERAYFSTPQNALDYLVELKIRKTDLKDLKTVCEKIDEIHTLITNLDITEKC
jgi:hypothetical protein